jgi:acetyl esterase/lipase
MASWQSGLIKLLMRQQVRKLDRLNLSVWDEHTSVSAFRDYCENGAARAKLQAGVETVPVNIPGLPAGLSAEWLLRSAVAKVPRVEDAVIFYCHGGGYISGSCADRLP